jgi:hypothetical protein
LDTFNFNNVIANSSVLYLGARKIEEIGDYGLEIFSIYFDELIFIS